MIGTLIIVQFVLTALIVAAVMLQKSASMGLGAYSGSNESLFGAKGPVGFLAKFTFILAIVFVANTVYLGYMYNQANKTTLLDSVNIEKNIIPAGEAKKAEANPAPSAPKAPTSDEKK